MLYTPEFFSQKEFYDIELMNSHLLYIIDKIRSYFGYVYEHVSCVIHCSNEPPKSKVHVAGSKHYQNEAVDFHINCKDRWGKVVEYQFVALEVANYLHFTTMWNDVGIGFYPEWNSPGFHLDWSPDKHREWQAKYVENADGNKIQVYTPVNYIFE